MLIHKDLVVFEGYEIDRACWSLRWQEETIALNRKTFDLLLYLVDRRDRVVSKDELLKALWPEQFVEESNLTQHVFLLRKALSRHHSGSGSGSRMIETVAGRGYRFTAPVAEAAPAPERIAIGVSQSITRITVEEEETSEGARPVSAGALSQHPSRGVARVVMLLMTLLLILVVAAWFGWQRWLDHTGGTPVDVVLTPMEGTTGDAILDRALVDALRMDLAQSPFVSVVSSARVSATLTQMMHKPDDAMTSAMAREVCERTNSQAVLSGSIARDGQHYLLTEEATSCVNGIVLAEAKREAASAEDLPPSVDKVAESLRRKLGESRRSIARFDTPLFPLNTVSLEALKDISQAVRDADQGHVVEAVGLAKQAIAADPGFATAYYDLAIFDFTIADYPGGNAAMLKAYSLRDSASEPVQLAINMTHNKIVTQDLFADERNSRNWTELYPRASSAWSHLANTEGELGRPAASAAANANAVNLSPNHEGVISNLVLAQIHSGNPAAGRATLDNAVARKIDGYLLRKGYLILASLTHDDALYRVQEAWGAAHPDAAFFFAFDAEVAVGQGRFSDARRLMTQSADTLRRQGQASAADTTTREIGIELMEAGDMTDGKQMFASSPVDAEGYYDLIGLADEGEFAQAGSGVHAMLAKYPQGTLWNLYYGPRVLAAIAISEHRMQDALALLEPARQFDRREDLMFPQFRADAYFKAGQVKGAEKEYRAILAHPEVNPASAAIPLSWLGLGRALAAQANQHDAIDAYKHFFQLWAHADVDALYLRQAKQEFAALQSKAHA